MLRSRKSKISLDTVRNLDSFPKLPNTFVETSRIGATISIITCILICWLVWSEIDYYFDSRFMFKFTPDTDYVAKLKINIDLTVAMPCHSVGADILDSTSQNMNAFGTLQEENTWFELSESQRIYFDNMRHVNSYLREEYHAVQELLWKSGAAYIYGQLPRRTDEPVSPPDACRIYGSLVLNKVAGNFHITAGKSISLPWSGQDHLHISPLLSEHSYNFSHRINQFSFGDPSPGIVHPLEGDEKLATENMVLYQYFIEVVPTDIKSFLRHSYSYQYSVKDHIRTINHVEGSHGMPGIFFKYDMSALKVLVTEERDPLDQFLVRLCATVGGIFVLSGVINSIIQFITGKISSYVSPNQTKVYQNTATPKTESNVTQNNILLPDKQESIREANTL